MSVFYLMKGVGEGGGAGRLGRQAPCWFRWHPSSALLCPLWPLCSNRALFEETNENGFREHVKLEHNITDYLWVPPNA